MDTVGWKLTARAMDQLVVGSVLHSPSAAMRPKSCAPLTEWSHFELLTYLSRQAWLASPWEKGQRSPEPLHLPCGSARQWAPATPFAGSTGWGAAGHAGCRH